MILLNRPLCKGDKKTLALLNILARQGRVYHGQRYVAKLLGKTQQAISVGYRRLEKAGRIRRLASIDHPQREVIELVSLPKAKTSFSTGCRQIAAYSYIPEKQRKGNSNPVIDSRGKNSFLTLKTMINEHKESPPIRDISFIFYSTMGAIGSLRLTAFLHKIYKGLGMRIYNGKDTKNNTGVQRGNTSFVLSLGFRIRDAFLSYRRNHQRSIFSGRGLCSMLSYYYDRKGPIDQTVLPEGEDRMVTDKPLQGIQDDKGYRQDCV